VYDQPWTDTAFPPPARQFDPIVSTARELVQSRSGAMRYRRADAGRQCRSEQVAAPRNRCTSHPEHAVIEARPLFPGSTIDLSMRQPNASSILNGEDAMSLGGEIIELFFRRARHRGIMPTTCDNPNRRDSGITSMPHSRRFGF
jgi:hypothetical protein